MIYFKLDALNISAFAAYPYPQSTCHVNEANLRVQDFWIQEKIINIIEILIILIYFISLHF